MGTKTSERLIEAMKDIEINAAELVKRSGVGKASVSQYIHGTYVPNTKTAELLGKTLRVNPLWLMGYDVPKKTVYNHAEETVEQREIDNLLENDLLKQLLFAGGKAPEEAVQFAIMALEAAAKKCEEK